MSKFFTKLLVVCMAVFLCFSSCSKDKTEEPVATGEPMEIEEGKDDTGADAKSGDAYVKGEEGVIYVNKASLYTETDDGQMKWAAEASIGDIAVYLGEKKEAKRTDGQKRMFFHIQLKEKEFWIQDYCYEPGTVPAFIAGDETILYKSDSLTAASDEIIPKYFFVAVYKDSINTGHYKFVKIACYCPELVYSWVVKEKFVKAELVEFDKTSIEAMLLATVAMESKNETIRNELFQNAIELNSKYSDDIAGLQNLAAVMEIENEFLNKIKIEKIKEKFTASQDIELLSIPSLNESRVLASVKADTALTASKKASITSDDGETEDWYFVQNKQSKGWIQSTLVK